MQSNTNNNLYRVVTAIGVISLSLFTSTARADQWDKKTILTVNEPIQVRETVLQPGQYVFKLLDSQSDRHIVQIFNYNQTRIIDTELAIPNYRLEPTGKSRFTFWETPSDRVRALRAWFYPGDNFGQEFVYPKSLAMAKTSSATVTYHQLQPEPVASSEQPTTAPAPIYQPDNVAVETQAVAPSQEPVLMAQNTPPANAPPMSSAGSADNDHTAAVLPKTASVYPLIGLAGLLSLALLAILRRTALTS